MSYDRYVVYVLHCDDTDCLATIEVTYGEEGADTKARSLGWQIISYANHDMTEHYCETHRRDERS